jgi:tetratricopeptide (TPR) repeat protein
MAQATVHDIQEFKARQLVEDGRHFIFEGDLDASVEAFQKSIEVRETAEAYTFLGWVLSLKGLYDDAIELCKKAICIDSSYGNAFNDIGSYLIQKNQLEDAVPWLEMALDKKNGEARHFPHINLGRVYTAQGRTFEAILQFRKALEISPNHPEVRKVLEQLERVRQAEE